MRVLETINLFAGYKKARNIIRDIHLTVDEGEFVGLFGTNGAGKSTILKAIMGILYQQEGQILYHSGNAKDAKDMTGYSPDKRSRMGIKYLTQDAQVFPNLSVKENLMLAVSFNKNDYDERIGSIFDLFPDAAENDFLEKKGTELSGGQREKIAIAMVLISNPRLLMLDEPSSGLSPNLVATLLKGIRDYQEKQANRMGVIVIEQQKLFDAKNICDSIYLLKNGSTIDLKGNFSREKLKAESLPDEKLEQFMLIEA